MGEFNETNNLAFRFADKLILGQSAAMDFTQQMADLLIQLQQLAAVDLIGLQSLGQLLQRELGLDQPRAVRQVGQPGKGAFVVDSLMTALLDLPVLLLQGRQILLPLLPLLIQCAVPLGRLRQTGPEFGELFRQCLQPLLALGLALLQALHERVVTQLLIQLFQLPLQRLALLSNLLQGLRCHQLLTKLSLLLLQFLLQFAQFRQGALLMLWRQGFQPQLQAR